MIPKNPYKPGDDVLRRAYFFAHGRNVEAYLYARVVSANGATCVIEYADHGKETVQHIHLHSAKGAWVAVGESEERWGRLVERAEDGWTIDVVRAGMGVTRRWTRERAAPIRSDEIRRVLTQAELAEVATWLLQSSQESACVPVRRYVT